MSNFDSKLSDMIDAAVESYRETSDWKEAKTAATNKYMKEYHQRPSKKEIGYAMELARLNAT